jgi:type I restriction enzyme S subunit
VARIGLNDPQLAEFFTYWFASKQHGGADFAKAMYGAARPHLSFEQLKGFLVPKVDPATAQNIVGTIKQGLAHADRLEAEATRARALLDRLEKAILTKAFRGELVPQDPNDEPASVLLERIRSQRAAASKPRQTRRARA